MKKCKISVYTTFGNFSSKTIELTDDGYERLAELIKLQYQLTHFSIEVQWGVMHFPANVIQNSVIYVEEVK